MFWNNRPIVFEDDHDDGAYLHDDSEELMTYETNLFPKLRVQDQRRNHRIQCPYIQPEKQLLNKSLTLVSSLFMKMLNNHLILLT